ncbi:hypothetical protein [Microcystis aeruginosa]|jgi:hypothetical protein|uniref:Uncharacterized protein n=2 Tax=Microcystis aeruginosa TaxID=1126 RepID=S3J254_MICAE|nr:hypothetical protein [Microcystis aeruginosa]EPF19280.1 hypothetical protein MAESPC_04153 [Microcystis aeruginosa SPC777]GCE61077.1 hypothetical protein MiAbB_03008 [Microcystis aeruginosa NIES-4285]
MEIYFPIITDNSYLNGQGGVDRRFEQKRSLGICRRKWVLYIPVKVNYFLCHGGLPQNRLTPSFWSYIPDLGSISSSYLV